MYAYMFTTIKVIDIYRMYSFCFIILLFIHILITKLRIFFSKSSKLILVEDIVISIKNTDFKLEKILSVNEKK
jgi:hypothetical protein